VTDNEIRAGVAAAQQCKDGTAHTPSLPSLSRALPPVPDLVIDDGDCIRSPLGWQIVVPMTTIKVIVPSWDEGYIVTTARVIAGPAWIETEDGRRIDLPREVLDAAASRCVERME